MNILQILLILALVIVIVWWALRRSVAENEKEAPTGHGHEEEVPKTHSEPAVHEPVPAAEAIPVEAPAVVIPEPEIVAVPVPEPAAKAVAVELPAAEPMAMTEEPLFAVKPLAPIEPLTPVEPFVVEAPTLKVSEPIIPDDLTIIEGIGPRISGVLKSNGVQTFSQLAAMEPAAIKAMLTKVDERLGRIAHPESWPQQAALAAKGDLEALKKLQDTLNGGRAE